VRHSAPPVDAGRTAGADAAIVGLGAAGVPAMITCAGGVQSTGRGARVATLPHAGAPDGVVRGRAATISDDASTRWIGRAGASRDCESAAYPIEITAAIASLAAAASSGATSREVAHGSLAVPAAAGLAAIAMTANNFVICFFFICPLLAFLTVREGGRGSRQSVNE